MADDGQKAATDCVIIGPSGAGKTALLATLHHASTSEFSWDFRVVVHAASAAMATLLSEGQHMVRDGTLPARSTDEPIDCAFNFSLQLGLLGMRFWHTLHFTMWDTPGGGIFRPAPDPATFRRMMAQIGSARSVLLCLDATDLDQGLLVFEHLRSIASGRLPCERFAVCLTKADVAFENQRQVQRTDPYVYARDKLLGSSTLATLQNLLQPNAAVGFGWSSVYGFLKNGEPNFDRAQGKLRLFGNDPEARDTWKPYGILDPFTFVVADEHRRMRVMRASKLV